MQYTNSDVPTGDTCRTGGQDKQDGTAVVNLLTQPTGVESVINSPQPYEQPNNVVNLLTQPTQSDHAHRLSHPFKPLGTNTSIAPMISSLAATKLVL